MTKAVRVTRAGCSGMALMVSSFLLPVPSVILPQWTCFPSTVPKKESPAVGVFCKSSLQRKQVT